MIPLNIITMGIKGFLMCCTAFLDFHFSFYPLFMQQQSNYNLLTKYGWPNVGSSGWVSVLSQVQRTGNNYAIIALGFFLWRDEKP